MQRAAPDTNIAFVGGVDGDGVTTRLPDLKPVAIPVGAFAGASPLPAAEVKTIGTPYLVMARADLARGTVCELIRLILTLRSDHGAHLPETSVIRALEFENSSAATTSHVPVDPGAFDYLNREQRGFTKRYGEPLYLGGLMFGLIGSGVAWARKRVVGRHRQYVDDVLDRLAANAKLVQAGELREKLDALTFGIDQLAIDVVRDLVDRGSGNAALSAVAIGLEAPGRGSAAGARRWRASSPSGRGKRLLNYCDSHRPDCSQNLLQITRSRSNVRARPPQVIIQARPADQIFVNIIRIYEPGFCRRWS